MPDITVSDINTVYTLGHSDRCWDELLSLLIFYNIATLVDIRAQPYSRRFPYFSREALRESVHNAHINYYWAGRQLGGQRKPVESSHHTALKEPAMQGFADYMGSSQFQQAILQLVDLAAQAPTAVMCAEKRPSQCHRSLISDYLVLRNVTVRHLIDETTVLTHKLNELARTESAELIYDRHVTAGLVFHGENCL